MSVDELSESIRTEEEQADVMLHQLTLLDQAIRELTSETESIQNSIAEAEKLPDGATCYCYSNSVLAKWPKKDILQRLRHIFVLTNQHLTEVYRTRQELLDGVVLGPKIDSQASLDEAHS